MAEGAGDKKIIILGAGVTGLTAAWKLSELYKDRVILLEKENTAGGLAATFTQNQFSFDIGSHRLHQGYDPEVDRIIKEICGDQLLKRERKGLIFLKGKALKYPPSAFAILFAFGVRDFFRFTAHFIAARLAHWGRAQEPDNFEDFTIREVGRSLYERFYKPYALKLWNVPPHKMSKDPAIHRVRKFSFTALYQDLRKRVQRNGTDFYYYPARGIGHLSTVLQQRFTENGGKLIFLTSIEGLNIKEDKSAYQNPDTANAEPIRNSSGPSAPTHFRTSSKQIEAIHIRTDHDQPVRLETEMLISTISLDALHSLIRLEVDGNTSPPFDLRWRGLRILYLITKDKIPCENETFYFPEPHILFGRVSEINKYSPQLNQDHGPVALTIEIPCSYNDKVWNMSDDRLTELCVKELQELGILQKPGGGTVGFFSKKIKNVYPVYDLGWRARFDRIYQRLNAINNLYMIGRTALFLHCNIDHCMLMAIKLAQYLSAGPRDKEDWNRIQKEFFNYRVRE